MSLENQCVCVCHSLDLEKDDIKRPKQLCDDCGHGDYQENYRNDGMPDPSDY